ncbi:TRAP transporter small permease [Pseudohoeflea coraliihabitans]|uniref:TRAP transporter small permease protein n=1 Tax=Pseudohoeflea coraliihabitans TaxID=2860393 RepID=A0ABS6WIT9_9HYPH|nr:TRAP transporter small permease subunit [Pseudohoeflea sp. DP4N28-3]MBW3095844.1 TRAP transporter small permease subunit [Pseudohoeflea sp. DP4N28-3]
MMPLLDAETGASAASGWRAKSVLVLTRLLEAAAMVLMSALAALVLANAVGRYAFSSPLPWSEELIRNILVWIVATGMVLAGLRQSLICCDILIGRISPGVRRVLSIVCGLAGSAVLFYCAYLTWQYLALFGRDVSPILRIPKGVMIGGVFFALAGLAVTVLASVFKREPR